MFQRNEKTKCLELWRRDGGLYENGMSPFITDKIKKEKITLRKHGIKPTLFWNIITLGNCCTYRIYEDDECTTIIHESYVIHRCYKFSFLQKNDIEIGPCFTGVKWRGLGIYPTVLNYIAQQELAGTNKSYMIIESNNESSVKGVIKAGYKKVCRLKKSRFLKIYKLMNTV